MRGDERVIITSHGLLFLRARSSDAGVYVCQTVEHGYVHTLLRITLHVLRGDAVVSMTQRGERAEDWEGAERVASTRLTSGSSPPGPSVSPRAMGGPPSVLAPHSRLWYKEFLQLIGYGDAQRVEEYCERVWCSDKKRKKAKRKYAQPGAEKRGKGKGGETDVKKA